MSDKTGSAQIGVIGLAVMGSQPGPQLRPARAHRRRAQPHLRQDRDADRRASARGDFVASESVEDFVASLEKPPPDRSSWSRPGRPTDAVDRRARPAARAGRHHHRRRQRALPRHPPPREAALREQGLHFVGMRRLRRRGGRAERPVDHARRLRGVLRDARPDPGVDRRARRRRAVLHAHRPRRRRPLRQDGAQRHRVRRHAAHRRGLRPAPPRRRHDARARSPTSSPSGTRATSSPTSSRSPPRCCGQVDAETGKPFVDVDPRRRPSRRAPARWTVQTALDLGVPVDRHRRGRRSPASLSGHARPARARPAGAAGPDRRRGRRRPRRLHRRRAARAVRLEDRRLRAGLRPDRRRRRGVRLGHRPRRDARGSGAAAASSAPSSSTASPTRTPRTTWRCWTAP